MGSKLIKPKKSVLRSRHLTFLSQQTGLTFSQINVIFRKFVEEFKDGNMTKEDFVKLYSELRPEPKEQLEEIASYVFTAFDVDKNNLISFNEFLVN
jgi:Ca2+-binding EF-hand superfamily protein